MFQQCSLLVFCSIILLYIDTTCYNIILTTTSLSHVCVIKQLSITSLNLHTTEPSTKAIEY